MAAKPRLVLIASVGIALGLEAYYARAGVPPDARLALRMASIAVLAILSLSITLIASLVRNKTNPVAEPHNLFTRLTNARVTFPYALLGVVAFAASAFALMAISTYAWNQSDAGLSWRVTGAWRFASSVDVVFEPSGQFQMKGPTFSAYGRWRVSGHKIAFGEVHGQGLTSDATLWMAGGLDGRQLSVEFDGNTLILDGDRYDRVILGQ